MYLEQGMQVAAERGHALCVEVVRLELLLSPVPAAWGGDGKIRMLVRGSHGARSRVAHEKRIK
jgi:hypothetical protein